ncbi:MAG TPA: IclR family transcriptional regulator [Amycolatopsis sp.]|nr:IclR family transcriptional regulator [Amycolatopsis sp.]
MVKQTTGQPLRSAERMLDVLESFSTAQPALSIAEISARLDLAPSTVRRLLNALEEHGFVRSDPNSGRFAPHYQIVRLAAVAVQGNDLMSAASPAMDELLERTGEAVQLTVRSGSDTVFLSRRESQKLIKIFSPIGTRSPAWDGRASGKIHLAWLPEADLLEMLPPEEEWPVSDGPNASRTRAEFRADLATVRERGYSLNDEETARDVWAVGAPVRDHTGNVVAAISVPALKARALDPGRAPELIEAVMSAGAAISRRLNYFED